MNIMVSTVPPERRPVGDWAMGVIETLVFDELGTVGLVSNLFQPTDVGEIPFQSASGIGGQSFPTRGPINRKGPRVYVRCGPTYGDQPRRGLMGMPAAWNSRVSVASFTPNSFATEASDKPFA